MLCQRCRSHLTHRSSHVRSAAILVVAALLTLACSSAPTASLAGLPGHYVLYSADGAQLPVPFYPPSTGLPQNVLIAAGVADITPIDTADSLVLALTLNTLDSLGQVTATSTAMTRLTFTTHLPDTLIFDVAYDSAVVRGTAVHLILHTPIAPSSGYWSVRHVLVLIPQ